MTSSTSSLPGRRPDPGSCDRVQHPPFSRPTDAAIAGLAEKRTINGNCFH